MESIDLKLFKDYIGEPVSQIEHMVQAAMAAEAEGRSKERLIRPKHLGAILKGLVRSIHNIKVLNRS